MAVTSTTIGQLALQHLGDRFSITSLSDASTEAEQVNLVYEHARDATLRAHPWNFAKKWSLPTAIDDSSVASISGATQANPVVITTSSAHGLSNGDTVYIAGVVGMTEINDGMFTVANVTSTTFELQDLTPANVDGSGYTAYSSGGTVYNNKVPQAWGYMFTYPSDALKVLRVINPLGDDLPPVRYEIGINKLGNKVLMCDLEEPEIEYIAAITDPAEFDPHFVMALSFHIASLIARPITGDPAVKAEMWQEYQMRLAEAEAEDANEGVEPGKQPEATWITARA